MQKVRLLLLLSALCWFSGQSMLYAQDYDEDDEDSDRDAGYEIEEDWDGYMADLYSRGDQTFTIFLGVTFPVLFLNDGKVIDHHLKPPVGGALGPLAYTYFITSNIFAGIEIGVQFNYTLGQNTLFLIPIGVRGGWQFLIGRFEIPLTLTLGIAPQRYLNYSYVGFFMKGGVAAYFRFNPDWSFGLGTDWSWYPQRQPMENGKPVPHKNIDANMTSVTLSARYHL